jgi:hypothetical protein
MLPPGRRSRRQALSTESLARSQHSTSVWMMTSKLPARNGSPLAAAATTPVRAASASLAARLAATRSPSRGRSVRTTAQPVRAARYSPGQPVAIPGRVGGRWPTGEAAGRGCRLGPWWCSRWRPVAADDPLLDLAGEEGWGVAVALLEQGPRLGLIPARHDHPSSLGPGVVGPSPLMLEPGRLVARQVTHRCSGRRPGCSRRTAACSSGRSRRGGGRGRVRAPPIRRWRISSRRWPRRTWRIARLLVLASFGSLP